MIAQNLSFTDATMAVDSASAKYYVATTQVAGIMLSFASLRGITKFPVTVHCEDIYAAGWLHCSPAGNESEIEFAGLIAQQPHRILQPTDCSPMGIQGKVQAGFLTHCDSIIFLRLSAASRESGWADHCPKYSIPFNKRDHAVRDPIPGSSSGWSYYTGF